MNCRALQYRQLRKRAWALAAALLSATECWAADGQDLPNGGSETTVGASSSADSGSTNGIQSRSRIAPPRIYQLDELTSQNLKSLSQGSRIPAPRQFVAATAEQESPSPAVPALSAVQETAPLFRPNSYDRGMTKGMMSPETTGATAAASVAVASDSPLAPVATTVAPTSPPATPATPESMPTTVKQAVQTLTEPQVEEPAPVPQQPANSESPPQPPADQSASRISLTEQVATPASADPGEQNPASPGPMSAADAPASRTPAQAVTSTTASDAAPVQTNSTDQPAPKPDHQVSPATQTDQPAAQADRREDPQIQRTQCATCGGFHSSLDGPALHGCLTCGGQNCVPGQKPCYPLPDCNSVIGAFISNLYQELCCPDPCYQPKWDPAAYASFFVDYARPRTVTRLRYDNLEDMTRPDRNQFWMNSVSPVPTKSRIFARLQQVYLYQEVASELRQLLRRNPVQADQPELGTKPGRIRRHQFRHEIALVRSRDASDLVPVTDLHAKWKLHK